MKTITRFSLFAVALLLGCAAFANGPAVRGKTTALSELAFGIADVSALSDFVFTNSDVSALAAKHVTTPASIAAPAVQAASLADQLLVTNRAGAEHYALEPDRMTVAPVWRTSAHVMRPPCVTVFSIPEPGGRTSDVLAQLTSCNPDFRRT